MNVHELYGRMVKEWNAIAAQPLSDEAKQAACLTVFRHSLGQLALSHFGQANTPLRFYLDMILLKECLNPSFARDYFGKLVIVPMWSLVHSWLQANMHAGYHGLDDDKPLVFVFPNIGLPTADQTR